MGFRLPELVAPIGQYRGLAFGTGRAPLYGAFRAFPAEEVRRRYPSRQAYVAIWEAAVDDLVVTGALRSEDAPAMKARGAEVGLPF